MHRTRKKAVKKNKSAQIVGRIAENQVMQIKRDKKEMKDLWLISYGDMITVFFVFFVYIAAISDVSKAKLEIISEYFSGKKAPLTEAKEVIDKLIEEQNLKDDIKVRLTDKGLEINLSEKLLFLSGKSDINPKGKAILADVGNKMLNNEKIKTREILVEGHTDSVPIRTAQFPSNWELSSSRACGLARFLIDLGVDPRRLQPTGFADTKPPIDD